jgi:uncharacterized membrane protein YhaH (DUF805 family)
LRPEGVARAHVLIAHSARRSCSGHKIFRAEVDDRIAKAPLVAAGTARYPPAKSGAGMGFGEAVKSGFSKYFVFSGRATRPEYWYFVLFYVLCNFVAQLCDGALGTGFGKSGGIFSGLFSLALMIPHMAVSFRRLHDTAHSGWWVGGSLLLAVAAGVTLVVMKPVAVILFLALFILALLMLFWLCQPGTPGDNRFGPPPPTAPGALPVPE